MSTAGGYKGRGHEILAKFQVSIGDEVNISTNQDDLSGVLMPRYESSTDEHIIIKLRSGYNIGVAVASIQTIRKIESHYDVATHSQNRKVQNEELPRVSLISTGGTIASRIDYRTGGVHPALTASELYESVPELEDYAVIDPEVIFSEFSENLSSYHWTTIATKIAETIHEGKYAGVVITHGTDTMHYTASALSFALRNPPIPIVLVGAQRSSDRPSSDAALNLIGATAFAANLQKGGVFVAMHRSTSDDVIACHMGTRVRKNHTSKRDAFQSVDVSPVALFSNGKIQTSPILHTPPSGNFELHPKFDEKVMLLKYFPGFSPHIIDDAVSRGYKAIILEGTGLGHVGRHCFESVANATKAGTAVFMTSQCVWGRVRMTVYDTGRDLLSFGVIPLSDMLSETALVKAMWALPNTESSEELKSTMQRNLANEMTNSIPI